MTPLLPHSCSASTTSCCTAAPLQRQPSAPPNSSCLSRRAGATRITGQTSCCRVTGERGCFHQCVFVVRFVFLRPPPDKHRHHETEQGNRGQRERRELDGRGGARGGYPFRLQGAFIVRESAKLCELNEVLRPVGEHRDGNERHRPHRAECAAKTGPRDQQARRERAAVRKRKDQVELEESLLDRNALRAEGSPLRRH